MLEDTPNTGYSDTDDSILLKEGMGKVLLASAERERALSVENQRLRKELDEARITIAQKDAYIEQLEEKIRLMQNVQHNHYHVGGNYINNQYNDSRNNE